MNLDDLMKKILSLEDETRVGNKTLTDLNNRIKKIEESNLTFLDTAREMRIEVERLNSTVSKLRQFDASLSQMRVDLNKKSDDLEKQIKKHESSHSKNHQDELNTLNKSLTALKEEITTALDKRMKTFFEEDSRLVKKVEEMESGLQADQTFRQEIGYAIEDTRRNTKRIESLQTEVGAISKKQDEMQNKLNLISDDLRKNDSRLNEMSATENQRKSEHTTFIEQQKILQTDQNRIWKEYEETSQKMAVSLLEFNNQQLELKRSKESFNEITQRFERRINELTETYRILEERLRQDWATFKADEEKRWANYSLIYGDKQGDFLRQYDDLKNRVTTIEDQTNEIEDVLMMVSSELQKGMQGLMKMVNNWIETLDDIRSASTTKKAR